MFISLGNVTSVSKAWPLSDSGSTVDLVQLVLIAGFLFEAMFVLRAMALEAGRVDDDVRVIENIKHWEQNSIQNLFQS